MNTTLQDPLSEITRKERRSLLGASAVGFGMTMAGLVPSKIAALGIEIPLNNQKMILVAVGMVVAYFWVAFLIYALIDFCVWRRARLSERLALMQQGAAKLLKQTKEEADGLQVFAEHPKELATERKLYRNRLHEYRLTACRAIFEFLFPIVFGFCSFVKLFIH